jgi:hypothetical protein
MSEGTQKLGLCMTISQLARRARVQGQQSNCASTAKIEEGRPRPGGKRANDGALAESCLKKKKQFFSCYARAPREGMEAELGGRHLHASLEGLRILMMGKVSLTTG